MLRIAIVGCGKIADQHAEQIAYIPDCQIVAVCDHEELMARQLQERLNVPAGYTEVQDLLDYGTCLNNFSFELTFNFRVQLITSTLHCLCSSNVQFGTVRSLSQSGSEKALGYRRHLVSCGFLMLVIQLRRERVR